MYTYAHVAPGVGKLPKNMVKAKLRRFEEWADHIGCDGFLLMEGSEVLCCRYGAPKCFNAIQGFMVWTVESRRISESRL